MTEPSPQQLLAVTYQSEDLREGARDLAVKLRIPLICSPSTPDFALLLVLTEQRLELRERWPMASGPIFADFTRGTLAYRRRHGGGRRQPLARAVGVKGNALPQVMDATAGLGRDGFVLAGLGCRVSLVERSPVVAELLRDGLRRAAGDPEIGPWVQQRLHLTVTDSLHLTTDPSTGQRPDVVYLDPMYPERGKASLVKKEMRVIRRLVGEDLDSPALLAASLNCARQRVVVKRPSRTPALAGPKPSYQLMSGNTRFDVYLLT